jgi:hypothetical protein
MKVECSREQDVLDALAAARWPLRCGEELPAHVRGCAVCTDLVQVAGALLADHEMAYRDAGIPSSGLVWWRAQLRAREEDARAAARPIAFIQGVAASVAVWLIVTVVRALPSETFGAWKHWIAAFLPGSSALPTIAGTAPPLPFPVLLGVGAAILLVPIAIYIAVNED